jgi:hypothetical protein
VGLRLRRSLNVVLDELAASDRRLLATYIECVLEDHVEQSGAGPRRGSEGAMQEMSFNPPIRLKLDAAMPDLPSMIETPQQAATVLRLLPTCGHWTGAAASLDRALDAALLRRELATALDRYGFLDPNDVDAVVTSSRRHR